jgi:predicted RNA binding protein YcfA (HicA-like mRNA interferase family)
VGRLTGFSGREVRRVAVETGWVHLRTTGDHFHYGKTGNPLNLSIPDHRSIAPGTLRQIIKTMGLTPDEFLRLAKK